MVKTKIINIGNELPSPYYDIGGAGILKIVDTERLGQNSVLAYIRENVPEMYMASDKDVAIRIPIDDFWYTITLMNCQNLKTVQAVTKGKNLTACTAEDLLNSYGALDFNYAKNGANVIGTYFKDKINMSDAPVGVNIIAEDGNDSIRGSAYNDTIYAGSGKDIIKAGLGNDIITGGTGNDKIYLQKGDNTAIFAIGDGADIVYKGAGNDTLKFTGFANTSMLIAGISVVKTGNDMQFVYTANDNVTLSKYFKNGSSVAYLMANNGETISMNAFMDSKTFIFEGVKGKANNITGTNFKDKITGNNKKDTLNGSGGNDTIYGEAGDDKLSGGDGNDIIYGGKGKDTIYGNAGNDVLYGEDGNDIIYGGSGKDKITGGIGKDKIYTDIGNDIVYFDAGDGADTLYKGSGSDTLVFNNFYNLAALKRGLKLSKSGNNLLIKYTAKDSITLYNYYKSGSSIAYLKAKNGTKLSFSNFYDSYIFNTYTGKKRVNKITGSPLNDMIKGNNKKDTLKGEAGNDIIYGYDDDDKIYGGTGNDILVGGAGNDTIYGQAGNDTIYGGSGDDIIDAGKGINEIFFNKNEGFNTVLSGGGTDSIVFAQETDFSDIAISFNGNDLNVAAEGTIVHLRNFSSGDHSVKTIIAGTRSVDLIQLTGLNSGTVLLGTDSADVLSGTGGLILMGGAGADIFTFNYGNGIGNAKHDTIIMGNDCANDVIRLVNCTGDHYQFVTSGNDLFIWYNEDNGINGGILDTGLITYNGITVYNSESDIVYCSSIRLKDYLISETAIDTLQTDNDVVSIQNSMNPMNNRLVVQGINVQPDMLRNDVAAWASAGDSQYMVEFLADNNYNETLLPVYADADWQ